MNKIDLNKKNLFFLEKSLIELKNNKPIQYIIGSTYFLDLNFKINDKVFIPRIETELLVSIIINKYKIDKVNLSIIDIGTGTGCIAICIKKYLPWINMYSIDNSIKSLEIARINSIKHNVNIIFNKINILKYKKYLKKIPIVDIIISNPPYVRLCEKKNIKPNVYQYEPYNSLFVNNNNPLIFYQKILKLSKLILSDNGYIYLEINQFLATETIDLIKKEGYKNIKLKLDIYGNKRIIIIKK